MMNALHLIWIIPVSAWFGFFIAAVLHAAGNGDRATARSGTYRGRYRLRPENKHKEKSAK